MVLTVFVLYVEAFYFERRSTSLRLERWKTPPFRHAFKIQTYLLLANKPNYTRGRVGCPSDTRPLN